MNENPPPRGSYRGELVIRVVSESDEPPRGVSEGLPEGRKMALPAQRMKTPRKDTLHSKRRTAVRFDSSPGSHTRSWQTLLEVLRYATSKKGAEKDLVLAKRVRSPPVPRKPRKRGQGSPGVTFLPKWRGDARTARREGVHGDAGIRKLYQNTKQMILT